MYLFLFLAVKTFYVKKLLILALKNPTFFTLLSSSLILLIDSFNAIELVIV